MEQKQRDEWGAARLFHLSGGLRAFNAFDHQVLIQTPTIEGNHLSFTTSDYYSAVDVLRQGLGRQVIGADFYTSKASFEGRLPTNWKSLHAPGRHEAYCSVQADQWSFLAHSAFNHRDPAIYDVSTRINHQMRVCDWRLRQVSEAYRDQLRYVLQGPFKPGIRFADQLTWICYLAIQSFLVDACILRDYFSEYFAQLLVKSGSIDNGDATRSMSGLKKIYLNTTNSSDHLTAILREATAKGGWLQVLGRYRDLVVHTAPLERAGEHLMAMTELLQYGDKNSLPAIRLPLPLDPDGLEKTRSNREHLQDPNMAFARIGYTINNPENHPDGLEYCHFSLCQLTYLSGQLLTAAPYKPEMPVITSEQGDITWT